jgi:repressor LexA
MADVINKDLAKLVGMNITNLLIQNDKTQKEMCDHFGWGYSTVSSWCNGTRLPRMDKVDKMCEYFGVTRSDILEDRRKSFSKASVSIPVYGRVGAGIPLDAVQDIVDREEIPEKLASLGEFYGLLVRGDSMEPRIKSGDVVIVRKQSDADDGDIVIALVNGNDAVCKRLRKYTDSIALVSNNPAYQPMYFTLEDTQDIPVRIIGKVVELRGKM